MTRVEYPKRLISFRIVGLLGIIAILFVCASPFIFFTAPLYIEATICLSRVSQRIGIAASYTAIYDYLEQHLLPGTPRSEVNALLETLGPMEITNYTDEMDETS